MPLARTALYSLGPELHIALWPGAYSLTKDITRFVAKESRAFVLSASGVNRRCDIPDSVPHADLIRKHV